MIFGDRAGVGRSLADRLSQSGEAVIVASPATVFERLAADRFLIRPESRDDVQLVLDAADASGCRGIIHLWSLNAPSADQTTLASLQTVETLGCLNALLLVQALATSTSRDLPRLWLVTGGTQIIGGTNDEGSPAQSPLWGLGRTIANEYPQLRCTMVDLSARPSADELESFRAELQADDAENELTLRGDARYVHRLSRVALADLRQAGQPKDGDGKDIPFHVEITTPGILDGLRAIAWPRRDPGPGEVEVRIQAAGLNFKDVMLAMGLLPDEALEGGYSGRYLGYECAGTVVAVGSHVKNLAVGDEVLTSGRGTLAKYTTLDARFAIRIPLGMSHEEAATIPIAFLTAFYSLHYLGRMSRGDRVLIHAAAGGVGLAAIQLAQRAGAEVFATAGSPMKRDLLRALGVKYVMDSRTSSFADEVMRFTNGEGVDIVLNSLAGEAIPLSLSTLRSYGRFLEIGKRDIYENTRLGASSVP